MNKFFAVVLSFVLITLPVTGIAQSNSQQFAADTAGEGGGGSMKRQLLMMSNASLGGIILVGCVGGASLAGSSMAFMAGSLIYLLGEITAGKDKNGVLKKRAEDLKLSSEKMRGTGDTQRKSLELALQEQEDMLAFLKKRKSWMSIANIAYMAAAGLAIAEALPITFLVFSGACPQMMALTPMSALGLWGAYAVLSGLATGEMLPALMGPVLLLAAAYFVPGMMTPVTRAALFTGAAILATSVASDLGEKQKVIEGNISKIKTAMDQFDAETGVNQGGLASQDAQGNLQNTPETNTAAAGAINPLSAGNSAVASQRVCASTGTNGTISIGIDCSKPVVLSGGKMTGTIPEIQNAAQTAVQTANLMAAGNVAGAEVSAATLNGMAAAVKRGNEAALKKLNDQLAREGKPKVDLDAETKKVLASMNSAMTKAMAQGGAPLMAALAPMSTGSTGSAAAEKSTEAASGLAAVENTAAPLATVPSLDSLNAGTSTTATPPTTTPTLSDSLDNYEVNTEDISTKKEESIWKQVSNRYILNYERIFDRRKPEAAR